MRKLGKFLKASIPTPVIAALLICAFVGAAIVASRTLTTSISVIARNDIELYDSDQVTVLTHVDFGSFYRGGSAHVPGELGETTYYIKNIGDEALTFSWYTTDWPADITLLLNVNGEYLDEVTGTYSLNPGFSKQFIFEVTVAGDAALAGYTPTIVFEASDS